MKRRSIRDVIKCLMGRRSRYVLKGMSMLPTLEPQVSVFVDTRKEPKVGDIVVFIHPSQSDMILIKRLSKISDQGLWLIGDNPMHSTDSRDFGWIATDLLIGVVCSFW